MTSTQRSIRVTYNVAPVAGKRNVTRYLRARAEREALERALREAKGREVAAFQRLSGGDLGLTRTLLSKGEGFHATQREEA